MPYKDPEGSKKYYQQNKERLCKKQRERYYANAEKRKAYWAGYREEHKEKIGLKKRTDYIRSQYGLEAKDYDALYLKQLGMCAICGIPERALGHRLCVDHCHATGKIRGLLCKRCNAGLGQFKDKTDVIEQALVYLKVS